VRPIPAAHAHHCTCGERFPGTLHGAWNAKLHAEDHGHRLRSMPPLPPTGP
jgi:hypothetical protein